MPVSVDRPTRQLRSLFPLGSIAVFLLTAIIARADVKTVPPAEPVTDPDYKVQGEYAGTISAEDTNVDLGVQIVARGNGRFVARAYTGGLPGDGWYGDDVVIADGKQADDGTVAFTAKEGSAVWKDGKLHITLTKGGDVGHLTKVERKSKTLGAKPPTGALVLFDGDAGTNLFPNSRVTEDGLLREGVTSKPKHGDGTLHVEYRTSWMPTANGQGRANSGVYLQGRYEVQVLDSFGLDGKNNEAGGIYGVKAPDVNMAYPPMRWQTYDIDFTAARYDEQGNKTDNARMTVRHNGVTIHENVEVPDRTRAAPVKESPEPGPLYLQNHGNPIWFRNVWFAPKK